MKKWLILVAVLALSGCAAETPPATQPAASPTSEAQGISSASEIVTLEDGIAYAKAISEDSAEIGATARALSDLTGDLPTIAHNTINQDLMSLNLDAIENPDGAAAQRVELWRIVSEISAAQDAG